jgi:DNA polymerase III subunit gamma/tau
VIARKWRPQVLQSLVGQGHIAQTLLNALQSNRIAHALLFTGPRGTGKTSAARILAKALRCPNAVNFVPCQVCPDCVDISKGRSIDVLEIDGASNNGVDSVRELRDSIGYLPSTGKYKIYIIDEVHMLSTSAFNALLKTLEEPPPHVVFILATTEVQKLPNTILSRCQRFDFKTISQKEISQHLAFVCREEKVNFEDEALWLIAKQAKGSMRDSQSLLDQVITFTNGSVTTAQVTAVLGLIQRELINQALQFITTQNILELADVVGRFNISGSDPTLFIEDLLEQLRNALMIKIKAHTRNVPVDIPESEITVLTELVKDLREEDIHLLFDIALKGSQNLMRATEPRMALEMLLFKMASAPRVVNLAELIEAGNSSAPPSGRREAPASPSNSRQLAPPPQNLPQTAPLPRMSAPNSSPSAASDQAQEESAPPAVKKDPWGRFVESVRASNGLLAALLEHTFVIEQTPEKLNLGMPEKMGFLMDKIKDPKNMERLNTFIESYWKQNPVVDIVLMKGTAPQMTPKEKVNRAEAEKKTQDRLDVENHPLIKKTQSLFKAEITAIKEEKRQ